MTNLVARPTPTPANRSSSSSLFRAAINRVVDLIAEVTLRNQYGVAVRLDKANPVAGVTCRRAKGPNGQ